MAASIVQTYINAQKGDRSGSNALRVDTHEGTCQSRLLEGKVSVGSNQPVPKGLMTNQGARPTPNVLMLSLYRMLRIGLDYHPTEVI
jgi:hypothetical protein